MKKIFQGEVYEVLPVTNGIIFSYCKDVVDEKVAVAYKMISFTNGSFTDITRNVYLITKVGNNYKTLAKLCENYITEKAILLPGGKVFLMSTADGSARFSDFNGTIIWEGDFTYRGLKPSDLLLYNNALWVSYPDCNALIRYSLNTMHEDLRIGGNNSPFDKPKDLFLEGENAMIVNTGSNKLIRLNLKNYDVFEYETFDEPLYQYVSVGDKRFVVLESGLYLI